MMTKCHALYKLYALSEKKNTKIIIHSTDIHIILGIILMIIINVNDIL